MQQYDQALEPQNTNDVIKQLSAAAKDALNSLGLKDDEVSANSRALNLTTEKPDRS